MASCNILTDLFATGQWLINHENSLVKDILTSYVKCNKDLALMDFGTVICRREHLLMDTVKLVSGGASGHEPAYAGFVGKGMLTCAIQGEIFQSPTSDLIFKTLKQLCRRNPHGVLIIINSRLSDRLAFGLAVEKINAYDNVQVKMIIVNDEVKTVGEKQGLTGTILLQKIAGGMVASGFYLDEVYNFCSKLLKDIATINVILKNPESPNIKISSTQRYLREREIEFAAGFHGEPGFVKIPLKTTDEVVKLMLEYLLANHGDIDVSVGTLNNIVIVVNNLGISTKLEERIFLLEVIKQLQELQMRILRVYCASFITSLNTIGFSLTIMRIEDEKILTFLDSPTDVSCWFPFKFGELNPNLDIQLDTTFPKEELVPKKRHGPNVSKDISDAFELIIKFVNEGIVPCERMLNLMDSEAGDSDTGTNMKQVTVAISKNMTKNHLDNPCAFFKELSEILEEKAGCLVGIFFSIMFSAASQKFAKLPEDQYVDSSIWLKTFKAAIKAVECYGDSKPGERTMLDPLYAAAEAIHNGLDKEKDGLDEEGLSLEMAALKAGVVAAEVSAKYTKRKHYADPGAHAIAIILKAIFEALKRKSPHEPIKPRVSIRDKGTWKEYVK